MCCQLEVYVERPKLISPADPLNKVKLNLCAHVNQIDSREEGGGGRRRIKSIRRGREVEKSWELSFGSLFEAA